MAGSHAKVQVSETGRLSLPIEIRRQMGLEKGGVVSLTMEDDGLRLETPRQFIKRIQKMAREDGWHKAGSVDDFIRERRAEAAREYDEMDKRV
jgi:bifunctional DNA-binding transcriptional regulator/antitoxin component of YhaV-PrlF toxin-antitoxin module